MESPKIESQEEILLRAQLQQKVLKHNITVLLTSVTIGTVLSYAFYRLAAEIMSF